MPVVTRVDDSVSAGETFMIYGEGFDETSKVYILPIDSEEIPEYDETLNLIECDIVSNDKQNQCLTVALSESAIGGSYHLYVTNRYGTSFAVGLNVARPQWISTDVVAEGDSFTVYGKNLYSGEFGSTSFSGVSFVNEFGDAYDIPVSAVNSYAIRCVMPDIPLGEYTVYVSNDGYIWNAVEDNRDLTVVEKKYDPYELGAAFASQYNFSSIVDISKKPYYITSGGDVTLNLQTIIDNVSKTGGGVVYLPVGDYYVRSIVLKEGVVLAGDGIGNTIIKKIGSGNENFISSNGNSKTGLANLSVEIPDGTTLQGFGIVLGKPFDKKYTNQRTAEFGFLKNISFKTPMTDEATGIGVNFGGKGHFLVEDCIFEGYNATISSAYANEYVQVSNNKFDTVVGNLSLIAEYATVRNNTITRNPDLATTSAIIQGIFMRGFSYVADNKFFNLGNKYNESTGNYDSTTNDGEIVATEPYLGGTMLHGTIVDASSDTVVVEVDTKNPNWDLENVYYAKAYLCITDGRGIGQYSRIKSYNSAEGIIVLENEFNVLPNATSKFVVAPLCENVTIYNNYCNNSEKGYWLYGDNVDAVVAKNVGVNTGGIYIRGIYKDTVNSAENTYDNRQHIAYFIDVRDNKFNGGSTTSGVCGIGVGVKVEQGGNPAMAYAYGINIRDNSISNSNYLDRYLGENEAPTINGIYVVYSVTAPQNLGYDIIRQIVVENNVVKNADRGITLSPFGYSRNAYPNHRDERSYSQGNMTDNLYVGDNKFIGVTNQLIDERDYNYKQ